MIIKKSKTGIITVKSENATDRKHMMRMLVVDKVMDQAEAEAVKPERRDPKRMTAIFEKVRNELGLTNSKLTTKQARQIAAEAKERYTAVFRPAYGRKHFYKYNDDGTLHPDFDAQEYGRRHIG